MAAIPSASLAWVAQLFRLFSRGPDFDEDAIAAIMCTGKAAKQARQMYNDVKQGGKLTAESFRLLMTECMSRLAANETDPAVIDRLVNGYGMGILKDFEKRCTARGGFMLAGEARHQAQRLRERAEIRHHEQMVTRQSDEKRGVQEAHVMEAVEFNRAWVANMEEFERRAALVVQELQWKQEEALREFASRQAEETIVKLKPSKAILELVQVQGKFARSGNYAEAQKCQRKINSLSKRDAAGVQDMAEGQLRKKVQSFKASQRLEMEALVARIERGRAEHRGHWTIGAKRLMQAHKNMLSDLETKQHLALNRAHVTAKTEIIPIVRRESAPRDSRRENIRALGQHQHILPPPKQRPSRIASAAPSRISSSSPSRIASASPSRIASASPGRIASASAVLRQR